MLRHAALSRPGHSCLTASHMRSPPSTIAPTPTPPFYTQAADRRALLGAAAYAAQLVASFTASFANATGSSTHNSTTSTHYATSTTTTANQIVAGAMDGPSLLPLLLLPPEPPGSSGQPTTAAAANADVTAAALVARRVGALARAVLAATDLGDDEQVSGWTHGWAGVHSCGVHVRRSHFMFEALTRGRTTSRSWWFTDATWPRVSLYTAQKLA